MKRDRGASVDLANYARVCREGTVAELEHLLEHEHANPNEYRVAFDEDNASPLMVVCMRDKKTPESDMTALAMVRMLLDYGASPHAVDSSENTALHYACMGLTLAVVKLLCESGAYTRQNGEDHSPLESAIEYHPDAGEQLRIVEYLAPRCEVSDAVEASIKCRDARCTRRLLSEVRAIETQDQFDTWLEAAARNPYCGVEIMQVLMAKAPNLRPSVDVLKVAFRTSAANMEYLRPFFSAHAGVLNAVTISAMRGDAMACTAKAIQCGWLDRDKLLDVFTAPPREGKTAFVTMRLNRTPVVHTTLATGTSLSKWYWMASCYGSYQFKPKRETILHMAARINPAALATVARCWVNPHLRDASLNRPIDNVVSSNKEARAFLLDYMRWRPTRVVSDWFGPFFLDRARAFLLVCNRLRVPFGRDVRYRIIEWVAAGECVSF